MQRIYFHKYQATGNDFILVDNREHFFDKDLAVVQRLCDRRFGIGSDGLILIEKHPKYDFEMVFFNPDGSQSLCGNGSRCAVAFARLLGIELDQTTFHAYDGPHDAEILSDGKIRLKMNNVAKARSWDQGMILDTGSPHLIFFRENIENFDVVSEGRKWRNHESFGKEGINVNFVARVDNHRIFVRTYERGVENETLSCGTGVTAAALALSAHKVKSPVAVKTLGGDLEVNYQLSKQGGYQEVFLTGPAEKVFEGEIYL